jgi:DNA-binding MltR family transcriptional regulator
VSAIPFIELDRNKSKKKQLFDRKKPNITIILRLLLLSAVIFILGFVSFQIYRQINLYYNLKEQYNEIEKRKEELNDEILKRNQILLDLKNRLAEKGVILDGEEFHQMDLYNFP